VKERWLVLIDIDEQIETTLRQVGDHLAQHLKEKKENRGDERT